MNAKTLEEYAIAKIESLEDKIDCLEEENASWGNSYFRINQELNAIKAAIRKVGNHKYDDIYGCNVVELFTAVEKYDKATYDVLSKIIGPVVGDGDDESEAGKESV